MTLIPTAVSSPTIGGCVQLLHAGAGDGTASRGSRPSCKALLTAGKGRPRSLLERWEPDCVATSNSHNNQSVIYATIPFYIG